MTDVANVYHVSPRCVRVDFNGPMRNNDNLLSPANYTVGVGLPAVTAVYVPTVQQAPYNPLDPNPNGGKPLSVYLVIDGDPFVVANPILVTVENVAPTAPVDYYAAAVLVVNTANAVTYETYDADFYDDSGLRVKQAFEKELPRLGKPKFGVNQPINRSMALAIAKLADLSSGGSLATLTANIQGPLDAIDSFIPDGFVGGFGESWPDEPGIGDTVTFDRIPFHIDKVWGKCDGSNTLFRTSIPYHPFKCMVLRVSPKKYDHMESELDLVEWFSPNEGKDRLLKLASAPDVGYSVIAIYIPRQTLIRVDKEIIAVHETDITNDSAIICGRSQLCTELTAHESGASVEDVWATSFVGRARYSLMAFGASGRSLEYIANERGLSRTDNPSFTDTELRRAVFNSAVQPRATVPTAMLAIRYIYPDLWPYIFVSEDVRWKKCLVIWYSTEQINFDIEKAPAIEPWETWLDHIAYSDGFPMDTLYRTYFRNPIGDTSYDGDYFLSGPTADDTDWPFPVVVSGPAIYKLGIPAPSLPLPDPYLEPTVPVVPTSTEYRKWICRPYGLDRVLPTGTGVLLLDVAFLT